MIPPAILREKRETTEPINQPERERAMLVLSRKLGEKILIGDSIVLTVVKIDRNQIRLGIEAPSDVAIYREEICPTVSERPRVVASITQD